MASLNQDQCSSAKSAFILSTMAQNTLLPILHCVNDCGLKSCYVTAQGVAGSGLSGYAIFKLVSVAKDGTETDISAYLNANVAVVPGNPHIQTTFTVSGTTVPKFGAVLGSIDFPTPTNYTSGDSGAVYFFLCRESQYVVPAGSTVCAKLTVAPDAALTANSLQVCLEYYAL